MSYQRTSEQRRKEYLRSRDKSIARARKWAKDNPSRRKEIVKRNNAKYSKRRAEWHQVNRYGTVVEREECVTCGAPNKEDGKFLVIHHVDGNNGKMGKSLNNEPSNLVVLCKSCHAKIHNHGEIRSIV